MIQGCYIDDNEDDLDLYSELLSQYGIEINNRLRPGDLGETKARIFEAHPQLVALDYRLDENASADGKNDYKAGGIAQILREAAVSDVSSDFPIVLISTEEKIHKQFNPDKTAHDLFDLKFLKSQLASGEHAKEISFQLKSLAVGYQEIIGALNESDFELQLLGLPKDQWDVARPKGFQYELDDLDGIPHVIARFWIKNLINRCGLLLNENDVLARLAVAKENDAAAIFDRLNSEGLRYEGLFSSGWPRYWRFRFDNWASQQFDKPLTAIPGGERAAFASKLFSTDLRPAVSRWNGSAEELFGFACSSCDHPTELRHSVAIHDPARPNFCERRRVCFDCVSKDEPLKKRNIRVDEADERIAEPVRRGAIKRA